MIAEENLAEGRVLRLEADRPPPIRNLSLAVIAGALMALAFPGWEAWILAWVALAPLLAAVVRERSPVRSFGLGWLSGTIFFYASCWWITFPPIEYADFFPPLAYALAVIPCAVSGLFFGLFALVTHVTFRRLGPYAVLAAPLTWVATEWLRLELTGVGWNMLGYSMAFQPLLIQSADLGGVYAVSFLLAASSTTLAFILVAPSQRSAWVAMAVTLALILANVGYGVLTMRADRSIESGVDVLAVQPNLPILGPDASRMDALRHLNSSIAQLEGLSAAAGAGAPPRIVVWPEIPVAFVLAEDDVARDAIARTAARYDGFVLVNTIGVQGEDRHTNAAVLVGPDGRNYAQYDKIRLLPFGEYVPLREIIPFLDRVPALAGDFTPGEAVTLLQVGETELGVSICFESAFPELARDARRAGAAGFINLTNDAWFGPTPEPRQHLAHSVLRSVETKTPQVRVTNAGYSAYIDATGSLSGTTPLFEEAVRRWTLPSAPLYEPTLYTIAGDWLPVLALCIAIGLLLASFVAARLARRRGPVIELE